MSKKESGEYIKRLVERYFELRKRGNDHSITLRIMSREARIGTDRLANLIELPVLTLVQQNLQTEIPLEKRQVLGVILLIKGGKTSKEAISLVAKECNASPERVRANFTEILRQEITKI